MGDRLGIHGAVDTFFFLFGLKQIFPIFECNLCDRPGFWFISVEMLVAISADRWPAVVATELAGVSLFLLLEEFALKPRQVCGLRQVGLRLEGVTSGLRGCSLISCEVSL